MLHILSIDQPTSIKYPYLNTMPERGEKNFGASVVDVEPKKENLESPPEGWVTNNGLAHSLEVDAGTVSKIANRYKSSNPDWFKLYRDKINNRRVHYHPKLVEIIRNQVLEQLKFPEGWRALSSVAKELGVDVNSIHQISIRYEKIHPEWSRFFVDSEGQKNTRIHPDLVAIIIQDIGSERQRQSGWISENSLARRLGIGRQTVIRLSEQYRSNHPEWFQTREYPDSEMEKRFYHSDLAEKLALEVDQRRPAPIGWETQKALADRLGVDREPVRKIVERYVTTHPEWFRLYLDRAKKVSRHYHPNLVAIIEEEMAKRKPAPEGWVNMKALSRLVGVPGVRKLYKIIEPFRSSHPEWISTEYTGAKEHYHPLLFDAVREELKAKKDFALERRPPEGWLSTSGLSKMLKANKAPLFAHKSLEKIAEKYRAEHPEWFGTGFAGAKERYHPELVKLIIAEIYERRPAPTGWMTEKGISDTLTGLLGRRASRQLVGQMLKKFSLENSEWAQKFSGRSGINTYYHPDLIDRVRDELQKREPAPPGWVSNTRLARQLAEEGYDQSGRDAIRALADKFRLTNPEWIKEFVDDGGLILWHYHPNLVEIIRRELRGRKSAPEGWLTRREISELLRTEGIRPYSESAFIDVIRSLRPTHPDWFNNYLDKAHKLVEHCSPDVIDTIRETIVRRKDGKIFREQERGKLISLRNLLEEASKGETATGKDFQAFVQIFGKSRALDILYRFRPEYRSLQPDYVKGVLADYLGDFLVQKGEFRPDDLEIAIGYLSDLTLKQGLFETIKDHALHYYFAKRQEDPQKTSEEIIYAYLDHITEQLAHLKSKDLDDVIADVVSYYDSVLREFHKPPQFVDQLSEGREFPDINQRINMKELKEKQRLLIADEMGLGKSASVIMAKEQMGVRCAVIVAPANVLPTWERYLSDDEQTGGYFKRGSAPRVLKIENPEQLQGLDASRYDYILVSQGRMNERYTVLLEQINFDMMVVDEVHKLKSLEGTRTMELSQLSRKVEGEGKYLALLSGTPAPNKVEDIAIILKLLYPEKFAEVRNKDLVQQIIRGDIIDLRSLLLPRMQMKSLEEGVEMPPLNEETTETELTGLEKEVYEVLLEEDELTASQKMGLLRQFLLNPDLLDATPGIESTKIHAVAAELRNSFERHSKVVMFVNGYIEGVLRGEHNILYKLGLPPDVEIQIIHGGTQITERDAIQKRFNTSAGKTLLLVSGQTADVGVDFSGAEEVFMYNEPWTEYDRRQQVARAYRPGLTHPLTDRRFITRQTIEEGIHEYIGRKYIAIEKLLRGIPIQEIEKELLRRDEKRAPDRELEVDPELAEYYFSAWDKLMKIYAHVKEIGQEDFMEFISRYGRDYAEAYLDLGNRSYQANVNRVAGTVIDRLARERGEDPMKLRILDIASGPEMLKQHIPDAYRNGVMSVDANPFHFKTPREAEGRKAAVGSWLNLPFQNGTMDYVNLAFALHYSNFVPSQEKYERFGVLTEMNRVLKVGGRATISIIYTLEFRDPAKIEVIANAAGFNVVQEYTGDADTGDKFGAYILTLEKTRDLGQNPEKIVETLGPDDYRGLKFRSKEKKLRDTRKIIEKFSLNGRNIEINFNAVDRAVLEEERALTTHGEALKAQFGGIEQIPKDEIIKNGFVRILVGEKYLLFKKLTKGSGVVIIK